MAPHQNRTKQGQTVAPLARITVGIGSRTCLANLSWDILAHGRTNVAGISRFEGEVDRHSGIYELHSCAICRVNVGSLVNVVSNS